MKWKKTIINDARLEWRESDPNRKRGRRGGGEGEDERDRKIGEVSLTR
jgi:hypothetical protein